MTFNNVIMTFIPHQLQQYNNDHVRIHVTQSTAVLHKHLNDELKILCLLQFFPEVAQNCLRIP